VFALCMRVLGGCVPPAIPEDRVGSTYCLGGRASTPPSSRENQGGECSQLVNRPAQRYDPGVQLRTLIVKSMADEIRLGKGFSSPDVVITYGSSTRPVSTGLGVMRWQQRDQLGRSDADIGPVGSRMCGL